MYQPLAEVIFPKYITGCMDTRSILASQRVRNPVLLESENIPGAKPLSKPTPGYGQLDP